MEFSGKVAIVTGGGKGIGRATALAFGREGASVAVIDVDAAAGGEVAGQIGERGRFVRADVTRGDDVQTAIAAVVAEFGGIDILHNNAGIQHYGDAIETTEAEWDQVLAVNLKSMFLMAKYAIPEMIKRGGGAIVNTASVQSYANQPRVCPYAASKAGILGLTRSLAIDFAKHNIRVNAVCPGSIETPMLHYAAETLVGGDSDAVIRDWGQGVLMGRVGQPEEIAQVVLFLASPRASYITGSAHLADGGMMAAF
jgi:NAD(P)-dependent dehydrogenase (short-subunit alcohol dehydrogenase family)